MGIFLILAFLFFIGSTLGWGMELIYRRFFSKANPERKWINPGYCVGPYLPLYGLGLCLLYLIASLEDLAWISDSILSKILLFFLMALCMTAIEYLTGILCLKVAKVRLWDYSSEWGNVNGIICPKFSLIWAMLGAAYYFLIHPYILSAVHWLSENLAFSFFIGMFFGIFTVDVVYSSGFVAKLKEFAEENDVIVRYENLKAHAHSMRERSKQKSRFWFSLRMDRPLSDFLKEKRSSFEKRKNKRQNHSEDPSKSVRK